MPPRPSSNKSKPDIRPDGFRCPFCRGPLSVYFTHVPARGIRRRYKRCENPDCPKRAESYVKTEERVPSDAA